MDRHREYAKACHAMTKAVNAAQTWQQILDTTDALMHLHLRFRLLDEECQRHEREQGSVAPTVKSETRDE